MRKAKSNISLSPKKKAEAKETPLQTSDRENASHNHELPKEGPCKTVIPKNSQPQASPTIPKQPPVKKPSGLLRPTASSLSRASLGNGVKHSPVRPQIAALRNGPTSSRESVSPDKANPKKATSAAPPPRTSSLAPTANVPKTEADTESKPDETHEETPNQKTPPADSKAQELAVAQEHELADLQNIIEGLKAEIERLKEAKEQNANLDGERLKTLDHQLQQSQQASMRDIETRNHELETLRLTLLTTHKDKEIELGRLRKTIQDLEEKVREETDEKHQLCNAVEVMQNQVQETHITKEREVDATRAALAQQHRDAILKLQADHEATVSMVRSEYEFVLSNPRPGQEASPVKKPKASDHGIENSEATLIIALKSKNEELRTTIASLHSSNVDLRNTLEDRRMKHEVVTQKLEMTVEELKQELGNLISEQNELKKSVHKYEEAARSDAEEALAQESKNIVHQQLETKKAPESNGELKIQLQLTQERVRELESNLTEATAKVFQGYKPKTPTGTNGELVGDSLSSEVLEQVRQPLPLRASYPSFASFLKLIHLFAHSWPESKVFSTKSMN